jgi:S-adenosylmethionine/arginine decarboxylase-like enzyme
LPPSPPSLPPFAALDIFTCGEAARPEVLEQGLMELLQPGLTQREEVARGSLNMANLTPEQRAAKVS